MFKYFIILFCLSTLSVALPTDEEYCNMEPYPNACVQFTVSQGTGCAWMCNYCANVLGTYNYYFTDGVCQYQQGVGCVGNPLAGKTYTCCAV